MFTRWLSLSPKNNTLLLGPRRAGKTTYLQRNFPNYRYVTLDDFDYLTWAKNDPKGLVESLLPNVIIDEAQRAPQITLAAKQFIDEAKAHILLTGSSSIGLLDSSADTLAGRIDIKSIPPACWGEEEGEPTHSFFSDIVSPPALQKAKRKFESALEFGGFPEVVSQNNSSQKIEILKRYRDTYFTRDLAQLSNIENIEGLLAILNQISHSIGSHLEVSNFARESGLSHPTAKKYLNVLTQSQLSFKLYGYHFGPAKRYIKASKMYFCDNGIFTALGQTLSHGQIVENFVICELEKRRKLKLLDTEQFYFYKSTSGAEIDLLFEQKEHLVAIEIKATKKVSSKDLRNLRDYMTHSKKKKVKGYFIYLGTEYLKKDDILCIPLYALYRSRG